MNGVPARAGHGPITGARLAIVTGASSGIGEALARELSRRGRPVLAIARRAERLERLAAEARAGGHAAIHPLVLDVAADGAAVRVRDAARDLGGAAWLVNNAGFGIYGRFTSRDAAAYVRLVRVNCEALVALTAEVLPDFLAEHHGVILNVASLAGFQPTPFMTVYGATKAFVLSFSEGLAEELRGTGVRVTAFCPGPVQTEFGDVAGMGKRFVSAPGMISAEAAARAAIGAAHAGELIAVPGLLNKLTVLLERLLPRAIVRRTSAWMLRQAEAR